MSEAVVRIACDRMECGEIEMTSIGFRQTVKFWRLVNGRERQVSQIVLEWPPSEAPEVTLDRASPPERGLRD